MRDTIPFFVSPKTQNTERQRTDTRAYKMQQLQENHDQKDRKGEQTKLKHYTQNRVKPHTLISRLSEILLPPRITTFSRNNTTRHAWPALETTLQHAVIAQRRPTALTKENFTALQSACTHGRTFTISNARSRHSSLCCGVAAQCPRFPAFGK